MNFRKSDEWITILDLAFVKYVLRSLNHILCCRWISCDDHHGLELLTFCAAKLGIAIVNHLGRNPVSHKVDSQFANDFWGRFRLWAIDFEGVTVVVQCYQVNCPCDKMYPIPRSAKADQLVVAFLSVLLLAIICLACSVILGQQEASRSADTHIWIAWQERRWNKKSGEHFLGHRLISYTDCLFFYLPPHHWCNSNVHHF